MPYDLVRHEGILPRKSGLSNGPKSKTPEALFAIPFFCFVVTDTKFARDRLLTNVWDRENAGDITRKIDFY
jgi:hypothetical protein